ncbi:hypothetical protein GCM10027517_36290 [Phycicoccus ginsengisoli]
MTGRERLRFAAVGGRSDRLRIVCTALGAAATAVLLLLVVTVLAIRGDGTAFYRVRVLNESGLRGGVVTALLLLVLPVMVFTGVSSRLGSPERDRRLAALRLAGASPADVRWVVALETGLAAAAGSVLGGGVFLLLRVVLDRSRYDWGAPGQGGGAGPRVWPTDVALHPLAVLLALAVVPVAGTLLSVLALRRVALTPFGVVVAQKTRVPAVLPAVSLVVGCAGVVLSSFLYGPLRSLGPLPASLALWCSIALALVGLLWGSASMALMAGRLLTARARGVAGLVAGRRLLAHPYAASKVTASVILAVVAGGAAAVLRSATLVAVTEQNAENAGNGVIDNDQLSFFTQSYDLVYGVVGVGLVLSCAGLLVLQAEALVSRRRALAGLVAAGTPRSVLVRATLVEVLAPLVPMVLVATAVSVAVATWWFAGLRSSGGDDLPGAPMPWLALGVLVVGSVGLVTLTTLLSLVTLRAATRPEELRLAT